MNDASTGLSPELVQEAVSVMGRAFVAIRSATSSNYSLGERLSPERIAALAILADSLHNVPEWIRPGDDGHWRTDAATMRKELDVALGVIDFLHGRSAFVARGPFLPELVHRVMPRANDVPVQCRMQPPKRRSWIGAFAAAIGMVRSGKARSTR